MPPRKQHSIKKKLTKEELKSLTRQHGIRFEGPRPSKDWPDQYKHHFLVVRDIGAVRYDDYKVDRTMPRDRMRCFKERVAMLRRRSYDLLDDVRTNEDTWREVEQPILERFDKRVICGNCYNEIWKPDFEAQTLHVEAHAELTAKRKQRKMCCCKNRRVFSRTEDTEEEDGVLFAFAKSQAITHAAGDDLENTDISMQPDRVIGLHVPPRIAWHDSYFPITGRRILLPFLVVEAKKEQDAPGFRAIQQQTAFPIRRFLKAQHDACLSEQYREPCLVWFLAYQGEQWRLHGCTFENGQTKLYELWQGTIQSQDGALQLLLLMDYIWSWARDIYRPSIRSLLFSHIDNLRDLSPASTDRFRQSLSLSTAPSPNLYIHDPDSMQLDETAVIDAHQDPDMHQETPEDDMLALSEDNDYASSVTVVRIPEISSSWDEFGSICYPNIVQAEFRLLVIPDPGIIQPDGTLSSPHLMLRTMFLLSVELSKEQLQHLATLWTTKDSQFPWLTSSAKTTLFFQTYLDKTNWQIKRVLTCICWRGRNPPEVNDGCLTTDVRSSSSQSGRQSWVEVAVLEVQGIHGRDSAWFALGNVSLELRSTADSRAYKWVRTAADFPDDASEFITTLDKHIHTAGFKVENTVLVRALLQVNPPSQMQVDSVLPDLREGIPKGNSILVTRPPLWPATCSKFCLFVLIDDPVIDKPSLYQLLQEAKRGRWYTTGACRLETGDKRKLYKWSRALR